MLKFKRESEAHGMLNDNIFQHTISLLIYFGQAVPEGEYSFDPCGIHYLKSTIACTSNPPYFLPHSVFEVMGLTECMIGDCKYLKFLVPGDD